MVLDETVMYSYGSSTALTSHQLHCKLQTRPLVREDALQEKQQSKVPGTKKNWSFDNRPQIKSPPPWLVILHVKWTVHWML
jgi:hypothetical protein